MKVSASAAAVLVALVALVASVQSSDPCNVSTCYKSGTTTKSPTTVTPTRLPVQSSTVAGQTTYAKDHGHDSTGSTTTVKSGAVNGTATAGKVNGTEPTVKSAGAVNGTTPKPTMAESHAALKQKLNTIAVKCKDELHAPQEIMALLSNTVLPQNEQQRCYLECVYKSLNLIKNNKFSAVDGKMLAQVRFAHQPEEHKKAVTIIDTCAKEAIIDPKSSEKCLAGRVIRSCFVKNGEKINFFLKA